MQTSRFYLSLPSLKQFGLGPQKTCFYLHMWFICQKYDVKIINHFSFVKPCYNKQHLLC